MVFPVDPYLFSRHVAPPDPISGPLQPRATDPVRVYAASHELRKNPPQRLAASAQIGDCCVVSRGRHIDARTNRSKPRGLIGDERFWLIPISASRVPRLCRTRMSRRNLASPPQNASAIPVRCDGADSQGPSGLSVVSKPTARPYSPTRCALRHVRKGSEAVEWWGWIATARC